MTSCKKSIGVIGATSIIGEYLLPVLVKDGWDVVAFTRRKQPDRIPESDSVSWQELPKSGLAGISDINKKENQISHWIILAPVAVLSEYFSMLLACGAKHIVILSSTNRFTKAESSEPRERKLAKSLVEDEERVVSWAKTNKLTFTILRPTLIYSPGRDRNINVIAAFIRRFNFFCVFGAANGLRQPIHAKDVASCCVAALCAGAAVNQSYNISGGEIIGYREMVRRIFSALDKKPRFVKFPLWLFQMAILILRIFPPFNHWSAAMAQRMNQDMIFDHTDARRDLHFTPRNFHLSKEDFSGKMDK
jgi:nucleoside-diphosphate-sugar epimerase